MNFLSQKAKPLESAILNESIKETKNTPKSKF
jgi:hypothetical protein